MTERKTEKRLVPSGATKHMWNFRVDQKVAAEFLEHLKRKDFDYFAALEKATNWHFQGVMWCTKNQKDYMRDLIKQAHGKKNGYAFSSLPDKYTKEIAINYCCKGVGKYGTRGVPPTTWLTSLDGLTLESIAERNIAWHDYHDSNRTIIFTDVPDGYRLTRKRKHTLFEEILDYCEQHYDLYIGDDIPRPRQITMAQACKLITLKYGQNRKLTGSFHRQKALEEVLLRYGTKETIDGLNHRIHDRLYKV